MFAALLNVPQEQLSAEIEFYNDVAVGHEKDPFGKTIFPPGEFCIVGQCVDGSNSYSPVAPCFTRVRGEGDYRQVSCRGVWQLGGSSLVMPLPQLFQDWSEDCRTKAVKQPGLSALAGFIAVLFIFNASPCSTSVQMLSLGEPCMWLRSPLWFTTQWAGLKLTAQVGPCLLLLEEMLWRGSTQLAKRAEGEWGGG